MENTRTAAQKAREDLDRELRQQHVYFRLVWGLVGLAAITIGLVAWSAANGG